MSEAGEDLNGYHPNELAYAMVRDGLTSVARLKATHRAVDYGDSGNCLFQCLQKTLARHFGATGALQNQTALRAYLHQRLRTLSRLTDGPRPDLDALDLQFRSLVVNDLVAGGGDPGLLHVPLDSPTMKTRISSRTSTPSRSPRSGAASPSSSRPPTRTTSRSRS